MIKAIVSTGVCLFFICSLYGQITIQGVVRDAGSSEVLIDAEIEDTISENWAFSDEKGRFTLIIPEKSRITVNFIGYAPYTQLIERDTFLNVYLTPSVLLEGVVVQESVRKEDPSVSTIRAADILNIPPLGGKPDIIKAIQTLPGIQGTGEGAADHIVRGGSPGENAYFIDGAPLIYINHLAGFLSVFNTDMINSIDVYKGGFPARHGGKLSSIVDIHQNSGNKNKLQGDLSLGITDLSGSFQGPIIKDKLTFTLTARKTLFDYLMLFGTTLIEGTSRAYYGFHDVNGKLSYHLNEKNTVSLNFYQGDDYVKIWNAPRTEKFKNSSVWGNVLFSADWETFQGKSLVGNTVVSFTKYRVKNGIYTGEEKLHTQRENFSSLELFFLKSDWNKKMNKRWNLRFGLEARLNHALPLRTIANKETLFKSKTQNYGILVPYLEPEYEITNNLKIYPGIRASYYTYRGEGKFYLDPRVRLNYTIDKEQSISSSFMRVHQFEHLLPVIGALGLNHIWIHAEDKLPVARSDQIALGYRNTQIKDFLIKTSVYYKWMRNITDYKDGYLMRFGDPDFTNKIARGGKGSSYGLEILFRKEKGSWKGSLSYAYIRSFRQFKEVNNGDVYPYDYDRPHNFNILAHRQLSPKWKMSAGWYFQSGLPYTPTVGKQYIPDGPGIEGKEDLYEVLIYGKKNSGRMINYHRLDLSASYTKFYLTGEKWKELTFGLYNAYYKKNPYYYFYNPWGGDLFRLKIYDPRTEEEFKPLKEIRVNYFPIVPYISCKWYLK